jgi:UDP-N-acetylmuramoyl-L-alanyl-D-glutamate--2,6-diaminopimelate ligase
MVREQTDSVAPEVRIANAEAAVAKYGNPARELRMVGVTGTNGKTTMVHVLRTLLEEDAARSASIGTLGVLIGRQGDVIPGGLGLTTPGPDELQRVLRDLADRGVRTVVMEVSSHALDQRRIYGVTFDAVVFTNFTRDHLDYHHTMETYFATKASLLEYLKPDGFGVVNADDNAWAQLPQVSRRLTFGTSPTAAPAVRAYDIQYTNRGSSWTLEYAGRSARVHLPLIGDFNVSNSIGAAAVALGFGQSVERVAERLSQTPQVPGRLELLSESPTVLRDYAHTPDALERALHAIRPFTLGRLIVVFGAGGDRDPGKRPLMGAIADRNADMIVVTSDNPRTEAPDVIIDDIERGMVPGRHVRIEDRREAIAYAMSHAEQGDVVLLAGKGHETYQVIGTERYPFDEREIVNTLRQTLHS